MKIELVSYRESWPADFERIKARLQELIGCLKPRFEHIGSTSVSGLCAKPIIDVMAGLHDEADLDKTVRLLQNSEFIYMPVYTKEIPFRRFYIGTEEKDIPSYIPHNQRFCHLHIVPIRSEWWEDHLIFRDLLRGNEEARAEYAQYKWVLSQQEWEHMNAYADAKTAIIQKWMDLAKREC